MAAGLVTTLPALAVFAPKVDQIFATGALLLVWMVVKLLGSDNKRTPLPGERGQEALAVIAGAGFGLLVFLSIGNAALGLVIGLLLLFGVWRTKRVAVLVLFAVGALLPWTIFGAVYGIAPWAIVLEGLNQHYELVTLERPYAIWVAWNLIDLLVFATPIIIVGFVGTVWQQRNKLNVTAVFVVGLLALVVVLDFSGSARGEIGRIWLFISTLLAASAAPILQKHVPTAPYLMLLLTLAIGLSWRTVRPVIVVAYPPDTLSASSGNADDNTQRCAEQCHHPSTKR